MFLPMKPQYSKQAVKCLNIMDAKTQRRIRKGINEIPMGDIVPLRGSHGTYRLRIGGWRVLFSYPDKYTVLIEQIDSRGQIYKGV
jgi:mRNA interferase RelE/StbE